VNRLAAETSPYLRQHRHNPVDWYPWGTEAFAEARRRDRPVLLSVGYSSCHWCHVMAHESFEDEATAALMNELFVNVKVDREERPDVDAIYMEAVQALTRHGGWPMTVFLTPEGRPFYGGTYYPPERRGGMPAFREVLEAIDGAWRDNRQALEGQADEITGALGGLDGLRPAPDLPSRELLGESIGRLCARHDARHGGFGPAPKFPHAMALDLLLGWHAATGSEHARQAAIHTLDTMARGGIYDHLGGGFARYSVDERWLVPHFEKMLYDNALAVRVYAHAYQLSGSAEHLQVVEETVGYLLDDLGTEAGGFASAEDADSEGIEGRFYVWDLAEAREACAGAGLDDASTDAVLDWYGLTEAGNFEGANVLFRPPEAPLARPAAVEAGRVALHRRRAARVRPGLDDKVLTEWNALTIVALALAGQVAERAEWIDAGERCADFLLDQLRRPDGRWLRSWQRDAGARHLAYAHDHAALLDAFVRLAEATGRARWIAEARDVADRMIELFWDREAGGLFTTGSDAEELITRPKDLMDNATPSANSTAAWALGRLGRLVDEPSYLRRSDEILRLVAPAALRHPEAFGRMLSALDDATGPATEVVVAGERADLVAELQRHEVPRAVLAWGQRYESPLWEGRADGAAYVCHGYSCDLPATTVEALRDQLARAGARRRP